MTPHSPAAPSATSFAATTTGLSASIGLGLDMTLPGGIAFTFAGDYGGIGTSAQSYGVKAGLSAPLN